MRALRLMASTGSALAALALAGCTTLMEPYERPEAPIPDALPVTDAAGQEVQPLYWQDIYQADMLQRLVALALDENRDLRIAAANVQLARAQYGISRSQLLPTVAARGSATEAGDIGGGDGAGLQ